MRNSYKFKPIGRGELVTRVVATIILMVLVGMVFITTLPYPLLKIALLIGAELGIVALMLGMFLGANNYFAGFQLSFASLIMLWLASHELAYVAAIAGLIFCAYGLGEAITRRSIFNGLLEHLGSSTS